MTDLLEKAVATAKELSPDMQDEIARMMLAFVGDERGLYQFSPEEAVDLDESLAAAQRGDFASDEEMRATWAKHGL